MEFCKVACPTNTLLQFIKFEKIECFATSKQECQRANFSNILGISYLCRHYMYELFSVQCPLKDHTYLNKLAGFSCRFV